MLGIGAGAISVAIAAQGSQVRIDSVPEYIMVGLVVVLSLILVIGLMWEEIQRSKE